MWKGTVLTAWRLLRCNPWGGKGYDPPSWPPRGLELIYGAQDDTFMADVAPKATVILGSAAFIYLIESMLHDLRIL